MMFGDVDLSRSSIRPSPWTSEAFGDRSLTLDAKRAEGLGFGLYLAMTYLYGAREDRLRLLLVSAAIAGALKR